MGLICLVAPINSRLIAKFCYTVYSNEIKNGIWYGSIFTIYTNSQVLRSDVITSLCGYSSGSEEWKVLVYVDGGASAKGNAQ